MYECMYMHIYVYTNTHTYTYMYVCIYTYIYIHIYIHVFVCVCVCHDCIFLKAQSRCRKSALFGKQRCKNRALFRKRAQRLANNSRNLLADRRLNICIHVRAHCRQSLKTFFVIQTRTLLCPLEFGATCA